MTYIDQLYEQLGNGGARYWDWYTDNVRPDQGYFLNGHDTPWCAEFVSCNLLWWGASSCWFPSSTTFDATCIEPKDRIYGMDLRPMDVISFDWGEDDRNSGDHTGFVVSVHDWGCVTIEGNTGPNLCVCECQRLWSVILFGIRPTYTEVPEVITDEDIARMARGNAEYVYGERDRKENRNLYNASQWSLDALMRIEPRVSNCEKLLNKILQKLG